MFPIAGQTAGPIGLKFFVDTHGWPRVYRLKKSQNFFFQIFFFENFFFQIFFFHGQRRALQLVFNISLDHRSLSIQYDDGLLDRGFIE